MPHLRLLSAVLLVLLVACSSSTHEREPHPDCSKALEWTELTAEPFDPSSGSATLALQFSAPPDLPALSRRLVIELDGTSVPATLEHTTYNLGRVFAHIELDSDAWADAVVAEAKVVLRSGVGCMGNPANEAPADRRAITLVSDPPPALVQAVLVHEGAEGHYFEVLCRDHALTAVTSRWTESAGRVRTSERCMPDLGTAPQAVHTIPALPIEVAATRGGFLVYGPFEKGEVELIIDAGTPTLDGGRFRHETREKVEVEPLQPRLSFLAQGRYLPRNALDRIGIRHRNVPAAELTVRHVPQDNLLFWMSGSEPATGRTSDLVLSHDLTLTSETDATAVTWLDLRALLPELREGLYEVTVSGHDGADVDTGMTEAEDRWWGRYSEAQAAVRVLLTDLQLVAKRSAQHPRAEAQPEELLVWALDTHGQGPQRGVRVELVRESGHVLGRCTTDSTGGCRIRTTPDPVDSDPPFALVARRGSDTTLLELADLELDPRGQVQGAPYLDAGSIRAAAWTDRGAYRPGDPVRLAAVLRAADERAPSALPITVQWVDSSGRELRSEAASSDANGLLTQSLHLRDFARTGRYHAILELADEEIGRASFMVEEIAPERIAVELESSSEGVLPTDHTPVILDARWLFGSPASGSRVELSCALEEATFAPPHNAHLHYGPATLPDQGWWGEDLALIGAVLDAEGHGSLACPPASIMGPLPGPARLWMRADVFEGASGRSSKGRLTLPVHPARHYIGLSTDAERALPGRPVEIEGLLVDWNGQALTDREDAIDVEIHRVERESSWTWSEPRQRFFHGTRTRRAREHQLQIQPEDGALAFSFTPAERAWGYLVTARVGEARTELLIEGERTSWGSSGMRHTPGPARADWLRIETPREVPVGQRVPVEVEVPQPGWLLLTAETWEVVAHTWVKVQPGTARWSFPVETFAPNVYVSALLVHDPHQLSRQSYLPGRSHGVRSVRVQPEPYQATVRLDLPDEVRPEQELEIEVALQGRGHGSASVVVAAVDEGLLSLTNHPVPDPLATLYRKRALGVRTYETVGWSLQLPSSSNPNSPGGDAAGNGERIQAVRPVALWSDVVQLPPSGRGTVRLPVPSYRGALRVVAVVATPERVAVAHDRVLVRDPLLLQASAPRFLVEGDEARVPVSVTNLTEVEHEVVLELEVEPLDGSVNAPDALASSGSWSRELTLAPGERGEALLPVTATTGRGGVRMRFQAQSGDLTSHAVATLPLTARRPRERRTTVLDLEHGRVVLDPHLEGWVLRSDLSELRVTASPYAGALTQLEDLLRYPHGCLEQTSSQLLVLLTLGPILEQLEPDLVAQRPVDRWVQAGVERLQRLQTHGGGFGYWPGSYDPSPWASAYALQVLMTAQRQGHTVPEQVLEDGLGYLERMLDGEPGPATAYAHYVLALGGRGQPARAQAQLGSTQRGQEAHYLLQAAVDLAGDHRYRSALAELEPYLGAAELWDHAPYRSPLRTQGLVLSTFHSVVGPTSASAPLAQAVAAGVVARGSHSATTQELAWAFAGLAPLVGEEPARELEIHLQHDGEELAAQSPGLWEIEAAAGSQALSLDVPDTVPAGLFAVLDIHGERTDGEQPRSDGLSLTRRLRDRDGEPVLPDELSVGQLVYVQIELSSLVGEVHDVALVERIPAGWEIENPSLMGAELPCWASQAPRWAYEHRDLRDDHIAAFGSLSEHPVTLVYAARVTTGGTFTWPGAAMEAMYQPQLRARTAPVQVSIAPPATPELL
jgi:uncharacterized protein YfaS (alpha-2-macroglobulin family)